jgi:hypothetical protein
MAPKNEAAEAAEVDAPAVKQIQVAGHVVEVSTPYAEGHVCTGPEAAALNQTRAENIGNNVRLRIKAILEDEELSEDEKNSAIAELVAEVDSKYVFAARVAASRATLTPVQKIALQTARGVVNGAIQDAGKTVKAWKEENGEDAYAAKVEEVAANEQIIAHAEKINKQNEELAKALAA